MKKLFVLLPFLVMLFLASCDTSDIQYADHEYVFIYNNEEHFMACDCGSTIQSGAHELEDAIIVKEPTCIDKGILEVKCAVCDYFKITYIPALGHEEVKDLSIKVGCENEGLTEGSHCNRCNIVLTKQETIKSLGHDFSKYKIVTPPTCEGEGLEKKVCKNCGYEIFNTINATGHSYSEFTIVNEATCEEKGLKSRSCACGHIDYQDIEPTGHTEILGMITPSTCIIHGTSAPTLCKVCKKTIKAGEKLPLTDHSFDDGTVFREADLLNPEILLYNCTFCPHQELVKTNKLEVTKEMVENSLTLDSFNEDIKIKLIIELHDYEVEYIRKDDIEYISCYDYTTGITNLTKYYKYEYNDRIMLYTYSSTTNSYTHQKYEGLTIFEDFKNYCLEKSKLIVPYYDEMTTKFTGSFEIETTYDGEVGTLTTSLNSDGSFSHVSFEQKLHLWTDYKNIEDIIIPTEMGNIHTIPVNSKCAECGMSCKTVDNEQTRYTEQYYIYEDLTLKYQGIENYEGALPDYYKTELEVCQAKYYEDAISYRIKNYLSTDIEKYSFVVESYTYDSMTGEFDVVYNNGTESVTQSFELYADGKCKATLSGSIYNEHPTNFYNKIFELRNNKKAYQFIFTEYFMNVVVYKTQDIVYLPDGTVLTKMQYGNPSDMLFFYGIESYYSAETDYKFVDVIVRKEWSSIDLYCEQYDISIVGTIYDVRCYDQYEYYIYIKDEDDNIHRIYYENGLIREIKSY